MFSVVIKGIGAVYNGDYKSAIKEFENYKIKCKTVGNEYEGKVVSLESGFDVVKEFPEEK